MWVFTRHGFLSIVALNDSDPGWTGPDRLLVRARFDGHLEALFPGAHIEETRTADYRFRARVERETVAQRLANEVLEMAYTNFKNAVPEAGYHATLSQVWSLVAREQDRKMAPLFDGDLPGQGMLFRPFAGDYVRQEARNRETCTLIQVLDLDHPNSEWLGIDGNRWATMCLDHGTICTHPTLALARSLAAKPSGWCEDCFELT